MLRRLVLFGLCCAVVEGEAGATSCVPAAYEWYYYGYFQLREAPVDVRPWIENGCEYFPPEDYFGACSLVAPDHEVSVGFDCIADQLLYFVPDEPLLPGRRYELACRWEQHDPSWVETRASSAPASPPETVTLVSAHYIQGDESCCGGDQLDVVLEDEAPAFLREGGLIEVSLGYERLALVGKDRAANLVLPPTLDDLELTPIAANGARGPTTRVDRREIRRQPVYIPCAVTHGSPSFALWLLTPLLWMQVHGRRRRRAR